jgi:DNA-binding transcriptional LysR family regulator
VRCRLRMELHHLRSFLVLAEELHFGRAADRLGVTQPSLSRRIQQIEATVGVALVDRSFKPLRMTSAGAAFCEDARRALEALDAATQKARQAASGMGGHLRIGFPVTFSQTLIPRMVERLRTTSPAAKLTLRELPISTHVGMLRANEVDICLSILPAGDPGLMQRHLWDEPLMVVVPSNDALAGKSRVSLRDLAAKTFVMCPNYRDSGFHEMVLERCREAGFRPRIAQEVDSSLLMLEQVARGVGVSLAIASVATVAPDAVVCRPIADKVRPIAIGIIWRAENDSDLRKRAVEAALDCAREMQVDPRSGGH